MSVPVKVNADLRPSRLVRSIPSYVWRSLIVICRIFVTYKPFVVFTATGLAISLAGVLLSARFLYYYFTDGGAGHVQSVILAALLLGVGFFLAVAGIIADLISVNRKLLERVEYRLRRMELGDQGTARQRLSVSSARSSISAPTMGQAAGQRVESARGRKG
jgi:hypothetical protein